MDGVGAQLKLLRANRGLSLSAVCARAGISKSTLSSWENGEKSPSAELLLKVLEVVRADPATSARLFHACSPLSNASLVLGTKFPPPVTIGDLLRAMRIRAKLSQSAVAASAEVSQSAVAKWESGESRPDEMALLRLGALFGISTDETKILNNFPIELTSEGETPFDRMNWVNHLPVNLQEASYLCLAREFWLRATRSPSFWGAYVLVVGCLINVWMDDNRHVEVEQAFKPIMNLVESYQLWTEGYLGFFRDLERRGAQLKMSASRQSEIRNNYAAQVDNPFIRNYLLAMSGSPAQNEMLRRQIEDIDHDSGFRLFRVDPVEIDLQSSGQHVTAGDPESAIELLGPYMPTYVKEDWNLWVDSPINVYFWACIEAGVVPYNFDSIHGAMVATTLSKVQEKSWARLKRRVDRLRARDAPEMSHY